MKSLLFFVKLSGLAFFLLLGMQQVSAQRISDGSAGHSLPYSPPCSVQGLGRSPALSALPITTEIDCKLPFALRSSRHPSQWAALRQGGAEYAWVSGLQDFVLLQRGAGQSTMWDHSAAGLTTANDMGSRRASPSLGVTAAQPDPDPPRAVPLHTIKLVLMGAALGLLVLGVGHKALQRW